MFAIKVSNGTLEGFLRNAKTFDNGFRCRIVCKRQESATPSEFFKKFDSKITETSFANTLQGNVQPAVITYIDYSSSQTLTRAGLCADKFGIVDKTGMTVVDNHLQPHFRALPDKEFHFLTTIIGSR